MRASILRLVVLAGAVVGYPAGGAAAAAGAPVKAPAPRPARIAPAAPRLSAGARSARPDPAEKALLEVPELRSRDGVLLVVDALERLEGVKSAIIDLNTRLAVVDYDPELTTLPRLLVACREAGYEASEYRVENRYPKPIKLKGG